MTQLSLFALTLLTVGCERQPGAASTGSRAEPPQAPEPAPAPGAVHGTVRLSGVAPELPALRLSPTVERECGRELPDRSLLVGRDGALEGVVVSVDAHAVPGPAEPVVVDQRRCAFWPPVSAARAGSTLVIRNSDPLLHNVRADTDARQLFNIGMPIEGMSTRKPLPANPSVVDLKCDVHTWMRAWVKTFDHPYFAVTGPDGRYEIRDAPAGPTKLRFWHPRLGELTEAVEVRSGAAVTRDLSWPAPAKVD